MWFFVPSSANKGTKTVTSARSVLMLHMLSNKLNFLVLDFVCLVITVETNGCFDGGTAREKSAKRIHGMVGTLVSHMLVSPKHLCFLFGD